MTCQVSHRRTAKAWKEDAKRNMLEMDGLMEVLLAISKEHTMHVSQTVMFEAAKFENVP